MSHVVEDLREFRARDPASSRSEAGVRTPDDGMPEEQSVANTRPGSSASTERHLLALQFALINLTALAFLAAAYLQGWLSAIVRADGTGMTIAIFGVFIGGLAVCGYKIRAIGCELNCVRNFNPCRRSWATIYLAEVAGRGSGSRSITASALRVKIAERIVVVRYLSNSLVLLGLIGTVLGFIIALGGVDPKAAGDVQAITPMVTTLIHGMSVALYTTLVGAVLSLWLTVNYRLLAGGAVKLATELVALGEENARHRLL